MIKTTSIISVGQAASLVQHMPAVIIAAAARLHIEPAMRINGIVHFHETDLQRIAEAIRGDRQW